MLLSLRKPSQGIECGKHSMCEREVSFNQWLRHCLIHYLVKTARKFFSGGKACSVQDATNSGKVFAISVDAIREPTVGALVSTIIKGQFYDSILNRRHRDRNEQRIAGLVMDDWPLCATGGVNNRHSDVSALGMIRSRRGFVIAATQGLSALDLKIGAVSRRAAMGNFANVFFFRGRDFELDAFASTYLGERRKVLQDRTKPAKEHTSRRQAEALEHERETFVPCRSSWCTRSFATR